MIKKHGLTVIIIILLAIASFFIYIKLNPPILPENLIAGSGRLDGDIIALNTKYPGRLESVSVQEGQFVKRGNVVAHLQSDEFQAKLRALNETIAAAKEGLVALDQEYKLAKESIPIEIKKAKQAVEIAIAQKKELEDSLAALEAVVAQDQRDYNRTQILYDKQLIGKQKVELSKLKLTGDTSKLAALQQKALQIEKGIGIAKDNVNLAKNQQKKLLAIHANINATKKKIDALQANRDELQIIIEQLAIKSPIDGMVIEKVAQPGEVIGSGMIIATLIDPQTLYLKMFVDTLENGKIKIGDKAVIFLDSHPDTAIEAQIVRIGQKAEFTPKEVNVKSDRIQRMYAVHIKPIKPNLLFKIGLPAISIISTDGEGLPTSLSEIPEL
ncbi:MAG: HlyD family efflux transporter periplasmic adaptor subunit [Campylobacterota bacterium]|nr:HlyD family efflux transporter periplasmic adaptor subunit [Campylobacterota bacterium]